MPVSHRVRGVAGTIVATEEPTPDFTISLPDERDLDQNEEFLELVIDGDAHPLP